MKGSNFNSISSCIIFWDIRPIRYQLKNMFFNISLPVFINRQLNWWVLALTQISCYKPATFFCLVLNCASSLFLSIYSIFNKASRFWLEMPISFIPFTVYENSLKMHRFSLLMQFQHLAKKLPELKLGLSLNGIAVCRSVFSL